MHKLVRVARVIVCWIVTRLCAAEDSDGVNGRPAALYSLGGIDGILSDLGLETIRTRRRAVGEEHNDLLGILAARYIASKLKTVISLRGAGRLDGADRTLERLGVVASAGGQDLHNLRIVVAVTIGIITGLFALLARKLYDGNLMLLGLVRNLCVFLGDGVNKAIGGLLQRSDTLGTVVSAHVIFHRTGSIQHHHDVERLAGNRRIGCRGDSRQRGQEI